MRKYLLWFVSLTILLVPVIAFIFYALFFTPQTPTKSVQLQIEPGSGLNQIATELQKTGVVRSALAVKLLARWNQQGGKVQAGNYQFSDPATPREILDRLIQGDVEKVSLTIPEGFTLQQIIARTAEEGFG